MRASDFLILERKAVASELLRANTNAYNTDNLKSLGKKVRELDKKIIEAITKEKGL